MLHNTLQAVKCGVLRGGRSAQLQLEAQLSAAESALFAGQPAAVRLKAAQQYIGTVEVKLAKLSEVMAVQTRKLSVTQTEIAALAADLTRSQATAASLEQDCEVEEAAAEASYSEWGQTWSDWNRGQVSQAEQLGVENTDEAAAADRYMVANTDAFPAASITIMAPFGARPPRATPRSALAQTVPLPTTPRAAPISPVGSLPLTPPPARPSPRTTRHRRGERRSPPQPCPPSPPS